MVLTDLICIMFAIKGYYVVKNIQKIKSCMYSILDPVYLLRHQSQGRILELQKPRKILV